MPALSPERRRIRAQYAAARRHHPEQDHSQLRADLNAAAIEDNVRSVITGAPHLTPEQIEKLVLIVRGAPNNAA